jgi:NAD(P)-dependent dehydrogenase (short-subunit alcohol dehydrogenase family)
MTQPFDLSDRAILITGASSGLGLQFARSAAAAGARLALAARRTERLRALADEITSQGGKALAIAMDVEDEASVKAGFDAAEAALGPIASVIANAGISGEGAAVDLAVETLDKVLAVNVRGSFLTAREAGKRMMAAFPKEEQRGRIVMIASMLANKPAAGLVAYCASKAAMAMMGRTLAREWITRGVNVNVVCPGYIETEINAEWFASESGLKQIASFPRRRLMTEQDLDPMVLYLASSASRTVTGTLFTLDDGQSL